jgi:hypothetical protein
MVIELEVLDDMSIPRDQSFRPFGLRSSLRQSGDRFAAAYDAKAKSLGLSQKQVRHA